MTLAAAISSCLSGGAANSPILDLPLYSSLKPLRGVGRYEFSRSSANAAKTFADHEGNIILSQPDEAVFTGSRRIHNKWLPCSENLEEGIDAEGFITWSNNGLTATTTSEFSYFYHDLDNLEPNKTYVLSIEFEEGCTVDDMYVAVRDNYASTFPVNDLINENPSGKRYGFIFTTGDTVTTMRVFPIRYHSGVAATGIINFKNIQIEDVTGQANQAPGEYVSVGVGTSAEMTVNGEFEQPLNVGWTSVDPSVTYDAVNQKADINYSGSFANLMIQNTTENRTIVGKHYYAEIEISGYVSGTLALRIGNHNTTINGINANGLWRGWAIATDTAEIRVQTSAFVGSIERISFKECDHGSNIDGVASFHKEHWNTLDTVTHIVTERAAPQLRQRVVANIASADVMDFDRWTVGANIINEGGGVFTSTDSTASNFRPLEAYVTGIGKTMIASLEIRHISGPDNLRIGSTGSAIGTVDFYNGAIGSEWSRWVTTEADITSGSSWYLELTCLAAGSTYEIRNIQYEERDTSDDLIPSEFVSIAGTGDELNPDVSFANWVGDPHPNDHPVDWDIQGDTSPTQYLEQHENGMRIVSDVSAVGVERRFSMTIGMTYVVTISTLSGGTGSIKVMDGLTSIKVINPGETVVFSFVAATEDIRIYRNAAVTDMVITDFSYKESHHGYFDSRGVGGNPPTFEYLYGYKGFNSTNGNQVSNNMVTAGNGKPIKPTDGVSLEESRTNIYPNHDLSVSAASNVTVAYYDDFLNLPFYSMTCDITATNFFRFTQTLSDSVANRVVITTVYGKPSATDDTFYLFLHDGGNVCTVRFHLTGDGSYTIPSHHNGYTTLVTVELVDPVNQIYKCTATGKQGTAPGTFRCYLEMGNGGASNSQDAGDAIYLSSPQIETTEQGNEFATSIIPTDGAAKTRAADELSYDTGNLIPDKGTAVLDLITQKPSNFEVINAGSSNYDSPVRMNGANVPTIIEINSGEQVNASTPVTVGSVFRVASRWNGTTGLLGICKNGGTIYNSAGGLFNAFDNEVLDIVRNGGANVRDLQIYGSPAGDSKLQEVSTL